MERKSFGGMPCPIARTLERVGEWWSILILRDALQGLTRFDQVQKSLGIAPNMLTRRLNSLVDAGMLMRRRYNDHPPRDEYVLTELGRDFRSVAVAMHAWGNKHFTPEGVSVALVDGDSGEEVDLALADSKTGKLLDLDELVFAPGPQATASVKERLQLARERQLAATATPPTPVAVAASADASADVALAAEK